MNSPYVRRLRLAHELKELRKQSGLTHEQLAKRIRQSRAQISRLENGHVVDLDDVMKILEAFGVADERWTGIMTIAREAAERGWWESNKAMGERQALSANLEAGAAAIREFQMTFIPGLLQTPAFQRTDVRRHHRRARHPPRDGPARDPQVAAPPRCGNGERQRGDHRAGTARRGGDQGVQRAPLRVLDLHVHRPE
jgi:transcriptional regulator with XRE-family HTH domain